jgi:hypothetical protein
MWVDVNGYVALNRKMLLGGQTPLTPEQHIAASFDVLLALSGACEASDHYMSPAEILDKMWERAQKGDDTEK